MQPMTANDNWLNRMEIGEAVRCLRNGELVTRKGWHGQGMYLCLVKGVDIGLNRPAVVAFVDSPDTFPLEGVIKPVPVEDTVYLITPQGQYVPWTCTQVDLLARDWLTVQLKKKKTKEDTQGG